MPGGAGAPANVNVYLTSVPIDPAKSVAFVSLPVDGNLHVFAMAISSP